MTEPCGQCAHLIKTVEELQRQLAIETDTSNKSVIRYIRQNASLDELKRDNLNLREDFDRLHSVALERTEEIARLREQLDAQTSAQATRSDSVVAEGVTLPVGEKPALVRYGVRWRGPQEPICEPRDDGFWTPWHIADASVCVLMRDNQKLRDEVTRLQSHPGVDPFADGRIPLLLPTKLVTVHTPWVDECRHHVAKGDHCPDCEAMKP